MRRALVPATLGLVLALSTSGWAGTPTDQLRGLFTRAGRILADPQTEGKPEERMAAIRTLVRSAFDFDEAARLSLGPDWSVRTPSEQARFVRLFADLLERSFVVGVTSRINVADGVQVSFVDESIEGATAMVRTTIVARSGLELPFDYRMIERSGRWAVCDVTIDGVSLAANYRAQFARVIQASSYPELVEQIQAKVSGATAETTSEDSPAAGPRETVAETLPDVAEMLRDVSGGTSLSRPDEPGPRVPVALEPAPAPPADPAEAGAASRSPDPQPAPLERSLPTPPLAVAAVTRPGNSPAPKPHTYWVQLGAFKSVEAAARLASLLRRQGGAVSVPGVTTEATSGPAPLTRVRVGPFPDREAATVKLRDLQRRGYQPFIAEARD